MTGTFGLGFGGHLFLFGEQIAEKQTLCIGSVEELFNECVKSVKCGFMKKNPLEVFSIGDMSEKNYSRIDLHKHVVDNIVYARVLQNV